MGRFWGLFHIVFSEIVSHGCLFIICFLFFKIFHLFVVFLRFCCIFVFTVFLKFFYAVFFFIIIFILLIVLPMTTRNLTFLHRMYSSKSRNNICVL
ncbi:hypothetical protein BY458DRAFT_524305 [Sporodiniella umbellata]|nr:hypothetical protein BY458DRAFT_524305 [Sporodiniella umbellata]